MAIGWNWLAWLKPCSDFGPCWWRWNELKIAWSFVLIAEGTGCLDACWRWISEMNFEFLSHKINSCTRWSAFGSFHGSGQLANSTNRYGPQKAPSSLDWETLTTNHCRQLESRYPAIPLPLPHDFPLLAINCSFSPASVNFHFLFLLRPMFQKLQSRALPSFLPSFLPDRPHKVRESLDTRLGRSKILACIFIYYHIYFIRLV